VSHATSRPSKEKPLICLQSQTLATTVLSRNDKDIPFALLYSIEYDSNDSASSATRFSAGDNQECTLRGAVGLPKDSPAGPAVLDFKQDHGFTPYFRQAMAARKPILIPFDENPDVAKLVKDIDWQGFGDPCRAAAICPLNPTSSKDNIHGFLVIGLNPRRPYDSDYRQFIMVATRLLSTSLTSIILHEEDIGRRERTIANAEAMKHELKQQLLETQKEVERSVLKFQRFAERADIGIFILDMDGTYSYRNDAWFSMLNPPEKAINLDVAWDTLIDDEYIPIGQARFTALAETKQHQYVENFRIEFSNSAHARLMYRLSKATYKRTSQRALFVYAVIWYYTMKLTRSHRSFELRLKRTWHGLAPGLNDSLPEQQPMWVICSIFPELTDDGEVLEIIGCITDIRYIYPSSMLRRS
jgi:PAS domain-containing protein